jgi:hypothetical protein
MSLALEWISFASTFWAVLPFCSIAFNASPLPHFGEHGDCGARFLVSIFFSLIASRVSPLELIFECADLHKFQMAHSFLLQGEKQSGDTLGLVEIFPLLRVPDVKTFWELNSIEPWAWDLCQQLLSFFLFDLFSTIKNSYFNVKTSLSFARDLPSISRSVRRSSAVRQIA